MERAVYPARRLRGEIAVPGDKSISHRALLLGAIARGTSSIKNLSPGADVQSTARALRVLGVSMDEARRGSNRGISIHGRGLHGMESPKGVLDVGNSGTTMRLLSGILAGQPFKSLITGDDSLKRRPMDRIIEPLTRMGAAIQSRNGRAPLTIEGGELKGIRYELPVASAQVKSCVLLAGLYADGETTVIEPLKTRDHTERLLAAMEADWGQEGDALTVTGGRDLDAMELAIPGDPSSAAFFITAAMLIPGSELIIRNVGLNPTRTGFLMALERMGAQLEVLKNWDEGGEPVADLLVRSAPELHAIEIERTLVPLLIDELPLLAVAVTQAEGTTVIRDAQELRVKETDRLRALSGNLRRMGVDLEERPDGLILSGSQTLKGARVSSYGDHRIAMAFTVAGLIADGRTIIEGTEWVDVSFPAFFDLLSKITD